MGKSVSIPAFFIWILTIINLALVAAVLSFVALKPAQGKSADKVEPQIDSKDSSPDTHNSAVDEDAFNAYGKSVLRAGLKSCAMPMNTLAERLLVGHKVGGYRFPSSNKAFGTLSMEVATKSGGVAYMTFNMIEPGDGQCIIAYEAVSQWNNKCEDVVKNILKDFIPTRMLGDHIAILTHKDNENRKVFTMPVNKGCVATEKEVITFTP